MSFNDHFIGFEKEEKFHKIWVEARTECLTLKTRTVKKIIEEANSAFTVDLHKDRKCARKLCYIGFCSIQL